MLTIETKELNISEKLRKKVDMISKFATPCLNHNYVFLIAINYNYLFSKLRNENKRKSLLPLTKLLRNFITCYDFYLLIGFNFLTGPSSL